MIDNADPWTLYWSNNTLQSCIASQNSNDADAINAIWSQFASELHSGATILDLATGNGAVPAAMLQQGLNFLITAVDRADIDPLKFLHEPGHLQQVKFVGGVDVGQLPFADQSYDALSSQFGIEYACLPLVACEAARVLKSGGRYQFLMHHSSSAIVSPNALLITELDAILQDGGLVDALRDFTRGKCSAAQLEHSGQQYLNSEGRKTKQISGQLFNAIGIIMQTAENDTAHANTLSSELICRLQAELARLTHMKKASLDEDSVQQFSQQLRDAGLAVQEPDVLSVGDENDKVIVGWLMRGTKS